MGRGEVTVSWTVCGLSKLEPQPCHYSQLLECGSRAAKFPEFLRGARNMEFYGKISVLKHWNSFKNFKPLCEWNKFSGLISGHTLPVDDFCFPLILLGIFSFCHLVRLVKRKKKTKQKTKQKQTQICNKCYLAFTIFLWLLRLNAWKRTS